MASSEPVCIFICVSWSRNVQSENSGKLARAMPSKANPLRASSVTMRFFTG